MYGEQIRKSFGWINVKERDESEDLGVKWMIVSKYILKKQNGRKWT